MEKVAFSRYGSPSGRATAVVEQKGPVIVSERSSPDPKEQKIENMNQIIKIIEEADHLDINYCMQIANISPEEGKVCFSGSITASQAADYIQNRVSIFLAEQG